VSAVPLIYKDPTPFLALSPLTNNNLHIPKITSTSKQSTLPTKAIQSTLQVEEKEGDEEEEEEEEEGLMVLVIVAVEGSSCSNNCAAADPKSS